MGDPKLLWVYSHRVPGPSISLLMTQWHGYVFLFFHLCTIFTIANSMIPLETIRHTTVFGLVVLPMPLVHEVLLDPTIMPWIGSATLAYGAFEYKDLDKMHTICRQNAHLMQNLEHYMHTQCTFCFRIQCCSGCYQPLPRLWRGKDSQEAYLACFTVDTSSVISCNQKYSQKISECWSVLASAHVLTLEPNCTLSPFHFNWAFGPGAVVCLVCFGLFSLFVLLDPRLLWKAWLYCRQQEKYHVHETQEWWLDDVLSTSGLL